jgi:hypothetical protein
MSVSLKRAEIMITSDSDMVKTDIQTPTFEYCVAVQN